MGRTTISNQEKSYLVQRNANGRQRFNATNIDKSEEDGSLTEDSSASRSRSASRFRPLLVRFGEYFLNVTTRTKLTTSAASCPTTWVGPTFKAILTVTVALYVLNQKHLLPRPLSAFVSQVLFWPTLPITASKRIGQWITKVDDTVIMGGAPLGMLNFPEKLYDEYKVRGVVNFCQEYRGPEGKYKKLGMTHLRLPTVDHFEPSTDDLMRAVAFIRDMEAQGQRVYVHCRAGHGRSAAAVMAWLLYKHPTADLRELNRELCLLRNVRPTLWNQRNLIEYRVKLQQERADKINKDNEDESEITPTT